MNFGHPCSETEHVRQETRSFLVLLYGALEYDGRVQRMMRILKNFGRLTIVDLGDQGGGTCGMWNNVRRIRIRLPERASKIRKHMSFWWGAVRAAHRQKPTVIVAEDYFTTLPAWISARLCRSTLIYDAHELIIPDFTRKLSKRDRFWYFLERLIVKQATLVIAANEDRADIMAKHYRLVSAPLVVRNISLAATQKRVKEEDILRRFPSLSRRMPNEVLIIYQGDISLSRGIDRFVRALSYLGPEYRMVVVGEGRDLDRLREIGHTFERQGRFSMLGRVEHLLLPSITRMADIGIIAYPFQGLNNLYCAPNKLFEYAQAGLPVVTTNQPPLRRLVENYRIGKLVHEHDSDAEVARAIRDVAENKDRYKEGLHRLLRDYRWENEEMRATAAIAKILGLTRCDP